MTTFPFIPATPDTDLVIATKTPEGEYAWAMYPILGWQVAPESQASWVCYVNPIPLLPKPVYREGVSFPNGDVQDGETGVIFDSADDWISWLERQETKADKPAMTAIEAERHPARIDPVGKEADLAVLGAEINAGTSLMPPVGPPVLGAANGDVKHTDATVAETHDAATIAAAKANLPAPQGKPDTVDAGNEVKAKRVRKPAVPAVPVEPAVLDDDVADLV